MFTDKKWQTLMLGCAAAALIAGCTGADRVASPGQGSFVLPPAPPPPPPPSGPSGPAASCPTGFSNVGIVANRRICQLPQTVINNLVLENLDGVIYSVSGQTAVGRDLGPNPSSALPSGAQGVLTIEPGVTIFGNSGLDYIVINRGSQIFAEGTATSPIIMTSRQNVEGTTTDNSIGQWGGLVINGRAPTTDGCPTGVTPPNIACEAQVEGSNAFYGGLSEADNSGRVRYLRVQYSGFEIAPNNELNGITLAGVGSGTVFEYVQVHNSSDDGIEIFGGNVNTKYIVITGSDDDGFDTDSGWRGAAQFGIVYQRTGGGDFGFETSSRGTNTPTYFTRPLYANFTVVQRAQSTGSGQRRAAIVHNTGHVGQVFNSVLTSNNGVSCLQMANAATLSNPNNFGGTGPVYNSVFFSCDGGSFQTGGSGATQVTATQIEAIVDAGSNNVKGGTSTLVSGFINGANENAVTATAIPAGNLPAAVTGFITPVDYIGAVRDANDDWYVGWTCGLPTTPGC